MSVIIAIKDKKRHCIVCGCDSQVTCGNTKRKLTGEATKLWKHNELPFLIVGGVGSLRDIQLVQTNEDMFHEKALFMGGIDYRYMVNNFVDDLYKLMLDHNRIEILQTNIPSPNMGSSFLVAFDDTAFEVGQDGSVIEIDDFLVLGSGVEVAMGVLSNNKDKEPKQRIIEAIKACAENTIYINNDILIMDTNIIEESKEIKKQTKKKNKKDEDKKDEIYN